MLRRMPAAITAYPAAASAWAPVERQCHMHARLRALADAAAEPFAPSCCDNDAAARPAAYSAVAEASPAVSAA